MNFFDYIKNESFFRPLTSKYRRVYYEYIQILIEKSKELPVLYETDARDCLTVFLRNLGIESLSEAENEEEQKETELQSPGILALFRECG